MSTIQLNTKDFASQTSSAEPVIASGVTGSPALALTNATFPAGMPVQEVYSPSALTGDAAIYVDATETAGLHVSYLDIVPKTASCKILVTAQYSVAIARSDNHQAIRYWLGFKIGTGSQTGTPTLLRNIFGSYNGAHNAGDYQLITKVFSYIHTPSYTVGQTITYHQRLGSARGTGGVAYVAVTAMAGGTDDAECHLLATEIQT